MPSRLRLFCCVVALAALPATLSAQLRPVQLGNKGPVITYDISFPQAAHHLARVKATFTALPAGPVNIRMARSSPGRYSLTEYAKNVFDVSATDGTGKTLPVTHPDPYSWTVSGHNGTVTFSYTLFADVGNGTYSGFNVEQEHIQPQGTFVYVKSLEFRPVRVTFHRLDPKWTIATQLVPTKDSETFTAPDMQYFFDSPTHLGVIAWRQWSAQQDGKTLTWRVALDDPTEDQAIDAYANGIRKIVAEEGAVYGEFPQYDYGTYTFVACYRDDCGGDGMEHRNSTSVTGNSMNGNGEAGLSTMAHEFFHSWNVKRIRPLGIEPFDYDRANMTPGLWIAEGFTQYYGPLLETRAGVLQQDRMISTVGNTINAVTNSPGRLFFGPIGMSEQAPFRDGAAAADRPDPNTFLSYYTYGAGIAIAIDLWMRDHGKSLDTFMQTMWHRFGKPEIAYSMADARSALIAASGDPAWASDFWKRYVVGHELPDYASLVKPAGLVLQKRFPGQPYVGGSVGAAVGGFGRGGGGRRGGGRGAAPQPTGPQPADVSSAPAGTPLYDAGLDAGDHITAVDGKAISSAEEFDAAVAAHKPGDRMTVAYTDAAGDHTTTVNVIENPSVELVTLESLGQTPTQAQLDFRQQWMGPHAK